MYINLLTLTVFKDTKNTKILHVLKILNNVFYITQNGCFLEYIFYISISTQLFSKNVWENIISWHSCGFYSLICDKKKKVLEKLSFVNKPVQIIRNKDNILSKWENRKLVMEIEGAELSHRYRG
jgi:hypothetical protein